MLGIGNLTLVNVSFSGNSAGSEGGAIYNAAMGMEPGSGNPAFVNVILWGNAAPSGAQLHNMYGAPTLDHSLVEGGCPSGATCTALVTGDPLLGAMGDHGGFTESLLPGAGSAAIDAGTCTGAPVTDQRGVVRPQGAGCDIGAVEVEQFALVVGVSGLGAVSAAATPLPVIGGIAACTHSGGATCQAVYVEGASVSLDATPDVGQHWLAWGGDCSGASASTTVTMDAAKTCTATFAISQFTVSFDSHGGSAIAAITQDFASPVTVPAGPGRAGYHFVQWNTAADGSGTAYAPGASFPMPAYDQTLHAICSNSAPSLGVIDAIVLNEDGTLSTVLTVDDLESLPAALTVVAASAQATILPDPSITADPDPTKRQMSLTPVADAFGGPIDVTVTVTDEGGLSASRVFQVQVRPVNYAPSFTTTGNRSEAAGASGLRTVAGFIATTVVGPANEADQLILGYSVLQVADPNHVVSSINVAVDGSLAYQLTGHGGTAQFEIRATDSGGTANGGQPTSAPVAFAITVDSGADLQISKSNGVSSVAPGASVVYDIYVANAGPNDAFGARVQDNVPVELENAMWSCTAILRASCAASSGTGSIDEQVDLPAGSVLRYSLLATAVETTVDLDLINTATVTAPAGLTELDASNNSDTDADRILPDGLFRDGFEDDINRITVPFTDRGD
ncbi:MAG TPA: choice-of-anchor Q domain-containing protein [Chiayiivirga sp.]|nr:choice-of-anchor Q domain-containing protein [Chiayiivirga sp.]